MIEFHLTHPDRGSRERNISSEKGEWCVRECVLRKSEGEMGGEGGGVARVGLNCVGQI